MSTPSEQEFGELKIFKDETNTSGHTLVVVYDQESSRHEPKIIPYEKAPCITDPSAVQFLDGEWALPEPIKGFKGFDGIIRLFRPMDMLARMNDRMIEYDLPQISAREKFLKCVDKWLEIDSESLTEGQVFYIHLMYHYFRSSSPPKDAKLYCNLERSEGAVDFERNFEPLKLYADCISYGQYGYEGCAYEGDSTDDYARLVVQCNYVLESAKTHGWYANFFVVWLNDDNKKQVVTPSLESVDVIDRITRDSVLRLLEEDAELEVIEEELTIDELANKLREGKVVEAFSSTIDDIIYPIGMIKLISMEEFIIPTVVENKWGEISKRLYDTLTAIMKGEVEHEWCHVCH